MSIAHQLLTPWFGNVAVMTAAGNYTITNEGILVVNKTVGQATGVTLPNTGKRGYGVWVIDGKGDAATNNITVTPASGNVNGAANHVISENYGATLYMYNGTEYNVAAQFAAVSAAELGFLNGVTAGTAAASKAMVTNASNTIGSVGGLAIGAAVPTNPQALLALLPPANASGVTTNQSYFHEQILPGGATTIPAGTAPVVASLNVHEPNITATGTVTAAATVRVVDAPTEGSSNYALWVDAGVTRLDGNLDMSDAALDLVVKANTAAALEVSDGTTKLLTFDSRNTVTAVTAALFSGSAPTIASAANATYSQLGVAAKTVTLTGTTGVDAMNGVQLNLAAPTITDTMACAVALASTLYVAAPVAADMASITAGYAAHLAGAVRVDGNLSLANAAYDVMIKANTAAALEVYDSTTKLLAVDSRNTLKDTDTVTITGVPVTVASETAAHRNSSLHVAAKTITYTGGTGTTSSLGAMLYLGVPTFTDADAMTLVTASSVHINAVAAAGGMLTISNSRMISTSVSDCFLTNAGVWTDTVCWAYGKKSIGNAMRSAIESVVDKLKPKKWKYRDDVHGDDHGRERVGIVYDDLPEELRAPGQEKAVSAGLLSSFALAAIKTLFDENRELRARLERLETA